MIVYGDPHFEIELGAALHGLLRFVDQAETGSVGEARELLAACGQLEQAVADADLPLKAVEVVTDCAASHLLKPGDLTQLRQALRGVKGNREYLQVKIPEGFAFYTVYPEQFAHAARSWTDGRLPGQVLVVGIRSIGTSLSAIVAAELRRLGWNPRRLTVRPRGHPFNRTIDLPSVAVAAAVVVDEGPGLSGSSIAGVVRTLRGHGVKDITIFPSHEGEPGHAASDEVRAIWRDTPRLVFPRLAEVIHALHQASAQILGGDDLFFSDLSGGEWRKLFTWPEAPAPAAPVFERAKYLFRRSDGEGVIWKYAGFGAGPGFYSIEHEAIARQRRLAIEGWTAAPVASLHGFIGTRWLKGEPLRPEDLNNEIIHHLARYIAAAAKPAHAWTEPVRRLRQMAEFNLRESISIPASGELPAYGDGRLAPHEWIRAGQRIFKTDVWGHDSDHTCIGPQPILWDVAGAIHEWQMNEAETLVFLQALEKAGVTVNPEQVNAYVTAWKAFKLGLAFTAPSQPTSPQ